MHFSPQPSYHLGKYNSEIAAPKAGSGHSNFESISLTRTALSFVMTGSQVRVLFAAPAS